VQQLRLSACDWPVLEVGLFPAYRAPFSLTDAGPLNCKHPFCGSESAHLSFFSARPNPSLNADVPRAGAARAAAGRRLASIR